MKNLLEEFIKAVHQNIDTGNWYGALFISLTLPDIFGKIDNPEEKSSKKRYSLWFKKYVEPIYTHAVGAFHEKHIFLTGEDCYALRCAFLHEGIANVSAQSSKKFLHDFIFVKPKKELLSIIIGRMIACNSRWIFSARI
ncbi:MAG: hypothetical protein IPL87_02620 [Candidatus Moraniibacteriota bacterium]|nr:MAG: hypothetical protein IPL87_02620 [Candidatus Moranbacteria bacterium]